MPNQLLTGSLTQTEDHLGLIKQRGLHLFLKKIEILKIIGIAMRCHLESLTQRLSKLYGPQSVVIAPR